MGIGQWLGQLVLVPASEKQCEYRSSQGGLNQPLEIERAEATA
jgi:hypothetical protein